MHELVLHNDQLRPVGDALIAAGQVGFMNGWGVFSTLRVYAGVMFAWERHYARMQKDAAQLFVPMPDRDWLEEQLLKLIDANGAQESTLRVAVIRNKGGLFEGPGIEREFDVIAFTRAVNDWGESVRLDVALNARFAAGEFSDLKITAWSHNLVLYERAHRNGYDEVVLMNERQEVSECTSANIFAIFGTRVLTPPLRTAGCLPGVTRDILLNDLSGDGVEVQEHVLFLPDLAGADEVFISSTTRETLSVSYINSIGPRPVGGPVRQLLQERYQEYTRQYTDMRKKTISA